MNWNRIRGRWKQLRGAVKERWGRLSHNDLTVIRGRREQLIGRLQELYGIMRDEAAREVAGFVLQVADAVKEERSLPAGRRRVHARIVVRRRRTAPARRRARA